MQKNKTKKKGVVALMMILILGTITMAISVSQFTYSMWMKQSLEWSLEKYRDEARASSASLYNIVNYFRDNNFNGTDVGVFYLTELDKLTLYPLVSGVSATTVPPGCTTRSCKKIETTFNRSSFLINQVIYVDEGKPIGDTSDNGMMTFFPAAPVGQINYPTNYHFPILNIMGGTQGL